MIVAIKSFVKEVLLSRVWMHIMLFFSLTYAWKHNAGDTVEAISIL